MKKLILLLLISVSMNGQQILKKRKKFEVVSAEAGLLIPIGKLANKFDYAQSYGFWFRLGEDHGFAANIGFTTLILKNPRDISYKLNDSIYKIKSNKFGLDFGIRVVKKIPISKNKPNKYLELDSTIGFHYLDYNYPTSNEKDNKNSFLDKTTFLLAPEIKYIYDNVGLKAQYRFAPFDILENFESKFGSHSIVFGIVYKQ